MSAIEKVLSDVISAATSHRRTGNTTAIAQVAKENSHAVVVAANEVESRRIRRDFELDDRQVVSVYALSRLRGRRPALLLFDPQAVRTLASGSLSKLDEFREEHGRAVNTIAVLRRDLDQVGDWYRTALDKISDLYQVRKNAANLLAHQQARALEWRSVADADERVGIGVYRRQMGRAMDQRDATRAERDALRAENERLHRANVGLVAQASSREHERKQLRAELARKDAEVERLQAALERVREICDEALPHSGLTIADTTAVHAIAALGDERDGQA